MKRCPHCSHIYDDDMSFCLSDGTPLVALLDEPDEPTVVRAEKKPAAAASSNTGLLLKILAVGAILFFGLVVLAGVTAWIFWPRDITAVPGNGNNANLTTPAPARTPTPTPTRTVAANNNQSNLKAQQEELDRERKRLEDERRRLEEDKRQPPATPDPPRFNDPGTTRVSFRRGSVGETVSGTVGRQRGFVLRTLSGQNLSASVRSPGGCVTFADGGSGTSFSTRSGDTYLYLRNNCGEPSRFALSITVR